jgi:uncharacterized protein with von Willebrand factor type A (vWA) domain
VTPAAAVSTRVSALAAYMRAAGAPVGVGEVVAAHRALAAVDPASRNDAFFGLRAALCASRADFNLFAEAFAVVFAAAGEPENPLEALGSIERAALPRVGVPMETEADAMLEDLPIPAAYSEEELLREKDFAEYSDAERAQARTLLARLARRAPQRISRRTRPTRRRREVHDLRATVRASLRHGGELLERRYREPAERPRRLVLVCDVSGSMAPYARAYLLLLEGAARGARAETFVFATRLTRVTKALREGRARAALERAAAAAPDWAGGTRLGEALRTFNDRFGRRGMARDAVIVVFSDGWERGDASLLGREMERLARLAYRIVWVNPRVAARGFAPVTGGMAAALPHVDELVSGHSLAALDEVVAAIGRHR